VTSEGGAGWGGARDGCVEEERKCPKVEACWKEKKEREPIKRSGIESNRAAPISLRHASLFIHSNRIINNAANMSLKGYNSYLPKYGIIRS